MLTRKGNMGKRHLVEFIMRTHRSTDNMRFALFIWGGGVIHIGRQPLPLG